MDFNLLMKKLGTVSRMLVVIDNFVGMMLAGAKASFKKWIGARAIGGS